MYQAKVGGVFQHGMIIGHRFVVEHQRGARARAADEIFTHDHHRNPDGPMFFCAPA